MTALRKIVAHALLPGGVLGAAWVLYELFDRYEQNNCPGLPPAWTDRTVVTAYTGPLTLVLLVLLIGGCAWAAFRAASETGRIDSGILAAIATSVIGSLIAVASFIVLAALSAILGPETIRRCDVIGPATMFIMADAWWPVFIAPVISLLLAAGVGSVGGLIGKRTVR